MPFATIGSAIWGVLKKTPDWLIWLIIGLLFWKWTDWSAERRGMRKAEDKFDDMQAAEQGHVDDALNTIQSENQANAESADEAVRDLPRRRHTDELRQSDADLGQVVLGADRDSR